MSQTRAPARQALRKTPGPEIAGVVVTVEPSYPREVGTGWRILLPILIVAGVARLLGLLVAAVLPNAKLSGGSRRTLKEMRRGPEFLVTEFTVREDDGTLVELETHGHLATGALLPRDRIRVRVRRQRRRDLPPRVYRVDNYTSGRAHGPHPQTMLTHLGPPLLFQALLGLSIILLVATRVLA